MRSEGSRGQVADPRLERRMCTRAQRPARKQGARRVPWLAMAGDHGQVGRGMAVERGQSTWAWDLLQGVGSCPLPSPRVLSKESFGTAAKVEASWRKKHLVASGNL